MTFYALIWCLTEVSFTTTNGASNWFSCWVWLLKWRVSLTWVGIDVPFNLFLCAVLLADDMEVVKLLRDRSSPCTFAKLIRCRSDTITDLSTYLLMQKVKRTQTDGICSFLYVATKKVSSQVVQTDVFKKNEQLFSVKSSMHFKMQRHVFYFSFTFQKCERR